MENCNHNILQCKICLAKKKKKHFTMYLPIIWCNRDMFLKYEFLWFSRFNKEMLWLVINNLHYTKSFFYKNEMMKFIKRKMIDLTYKPRNYSRFVGLWLVVCYIIRWAMLHITIIITMIFLKKFVLFLFIVIIYFIFLFHFP